MKHINKNKIIHHTMLLISLVLFSFTNIAFAEKGSIEVKSESFKIIETVDDKGKKTITHQATNEASIIPKDTVIYITTITNIGNEAVGNIVVTNPIAEQLSYVAGSAEGKATEISFSVDQGKTYHDADNVFIKTPQGKKRLAEAKEYNAIQWIYLPKLQPGKKSTVSFKAVLGQER